MHKDEIHKQMDQIIIIVCQAGPVERVHQWLTLSSVKYRGMITAITENLYENKL